jgi:hypothetical protein
MMSFPFIFFSLEISSVRSPVAMSVFGHCDFFSVFVKTIFGVSIIYHISTVGICEVFNSIFFYDSYREGCEGCKHYGILIPELDQISLIKEVLCPKLPTIHAHYCFCWIHILNTTARFD